MDYIDDNYQAHWSYNFPLETKVTFLEEGLLYPVMSSSNNLVAYTPSPSFPLEIEKRDAPLLGLLLI